MDLNQVIGLADSSALAANDFAHFRWIKYAEDNKEFKRPDLWTMKMIKPATAIYYPGDDIINARLNDVKVARNSWNLPTMQGPKIRDYQPIGAQPNGFVDMSGNITLEFFDKQDFGIELWLKSVRDLISHPISRFSYPVELLMSTMELAFHNTVQQKVKVLNFLNAVPTAVTIGDEDPSASGVTASAGYSITYAFPWHTEEYRNLY